MADDISSDEDEVGESVSNSLIKEMCAKLGEVPLSVEKHHQVTMLANRSVLILNDNAVMHIIKILQYRQKQLTLDKFLVKKARITIAEKEESTTSKRQRS